MLEYALVQERAKFHRLKYGCDPPTMHDINPPADEPGIANEVAPDSEVAFSSASPTTWRQGRQLLRQYLQEIGYTDTIIDVRSNRVRSLLGLNNNSEQEENVNPNVNGNENNKRASDSQGRRTPAKKSQQAAMAEAMILDSEAAVMANFEFLGPSDVEMSDDDGIADDLDMVVSDENDMKTTKRKTAKGIILNDGKFHSFISVVHALPMFRETNYIICNFLVHIFAVDVDAEAEEVLNELNSLTEGEDVNLITSPKSQGKSLFEVERDQDTRLTNSFSFSFLRRLSKC